MGPPSLAVAALLGLVATVLAEVTDRICQPAPLWKINGTVPMDEALGQQANSLGGLREKLSRQGMANVSYMIVNEKAPLSRAMYWELKRQAPEGVPVYQQGILDPDVWQILDGDKDDFLIYDKCGRLVFHISLPYSFLHFPYVESAVHFTYTKDYCGNCIHYSNSTQQEANGTAEGQVNPSLAPEQEKEEEPSTHGHGIHPTPHHEADGSEKASVLHGKAAPVHSHHHEGHKHRAPATQDEERGVH
ncbi:selenoprotein Pb [Alligator mississippiensis]|uniref:Selenoprotein Pb n=1 Tax=Alligator mississippiensis TaxID=8496 RepID=A0A151PFX8_ALLMI|nr:selenoprotein Pb [Alligator mississippiensis]